MLLLRVIPYLPEKIFQHSIRPRSMVEMNGKPPWTGAEADAPLMQYFMAFSLFNRK